MLVAASAERKQQSRRRRKRLSQPIVLYFAFAVAAAATRNVERISRRAQHKLKNGGEAPPACLPHTHFPYKLLRQSCCRNRMYYTLCASGELCGGPP